jgi:hypothetical protein
MRESLDIWIRKGEETYLIENASPGERKLISSVLRMASVKHARKQGGGVDFPAIFDELFDACDDENQILLWEILNAQTDIPQVIIVSHSERARSLCKNTILIGE